ncbi:MAG: hypothetical protein HLUCCA11_14535 [Phormidesmis priestleyi Ana]|uniref:Bacterial PH domain n=1 Tax=Phormidesmis priestleyi Ana TaxID=1666911 RepID=A0A0P8DE56_9CYAN|nr:MAG: hypothetical protein HLUCCA11_14535 [Phormidesmis priestleyi Ana]
MASSSFTAQLPSEDAPFKGRYRRSLGSVLLILGIGVASLSLKVMLLEGGLIGAAVLGVLLIIVGFLYLTRPYFAIAPNRLTIYNLLGSPVKRYPFTSFSQFQIKNSTTLYIEQEKVNLSRWMMHSADWKRLQTLSTQPLSAQ